MQRTWIFTWLLVLAAPAIAHDRGQRADPCGCVPVRPASVDGFLSRSVLLRAVESEALEWGSPSASLTVLRATPPVHP